MTALDRIVALSVRHVRTPEGSRQFHLPIGSPIGSGAPFHRVAEPYYHSQVFWHGTPSGDLRGASYGLHVGSQEAARQALHARIGARADGRDWDGTQEYGKTLLAGRGKFSAPSGINTMAPEKDYYPQPVRYHEVTPGADGRWEHSSVEVAFEDREPGKVYRRSPTPRSITGGAVFSDGSPVPMDAKPDLFPVRIIGPMTNTPVSPYDDFKANGYMRGQITRGTARRGYFYTNVGEDDGSLSAVVPNGSHLHRVTHDE